MHGQDLRYAAVDDCVSRKYCLGEPFSTFQIIGVVLIIEGVYIANAKLKD